MNGKWIKLDLGDCISCLVWVDCTPDTPDAELQSTALFRLAWKLAELQQANEA